MCWFQQAGSVDCNKMESYLGCKQKLQIPSTQAVVNVEHYWQQFGFPNTQTWLYFLKECWVHVYIFSVLCRVFHRLSWSQCLELRTWSESDNEIPLSLSELVVKHLAKLERIRIWPRPVEWDEVFWFFWLPADFPTEWEADHCVLPHYTSPIYQIHGTATNYRLLIYSIYIICQFLDMMVATAEHTAHLMS